VGQTSCEVGIDMGTSMATPIVAGAAVLVRQYFEDGWYPNGSPVSHYGFNPSAPLVKAVMLGATTSSTNCLSAIRIICLMRARAIVCCQI
jgi:Subtilase family